MATGKKRRASTKKLVTETPRTKRHHQRRRALAAVYDSAADPYVHVPYQRVSVDELGGQIGRRIRWLREMQGLAIQECEDLAGFAHGTWWRIEAGERGHATAVDTIYAVALVLGVDVGDLITGVPGHARVNGKIRPGIAPWVPPALPPPPRGRRPQKLRQLPIGAYFQSGPGLPVSGVPQQPFEEHLVPQAHSQVPLQPQHGGGPPWQAPLFAQPQHQPRQPLLRAPSPRAEPDGPARKGGRRSRKG